MTTPYDKIKLAFDELIVKYKEVIADGKLSFGDALSLLVHGSFSIAKLLQNYVDLSFDERKKIGVDFATQFYDEVIVPIDLPLPNFIEGTIEKAVRPMVAPLIEAIYEAIDSLVYQKLE